jgi:Flp pilus assembly protein TadG
MWKRMIGRRLRVGARLHAPDRPRRTRRHDERGAAMVEFALILPLVLLLTFGCIDFGFAFSDAAGIKSATRSGARIGSALSKQSGQLQSITAAVNASLGNSVRAQAVEIVVYTAPPGNFSPPSSCAVNAVTASSSSLCYDEQIPAAAPDRFSPTAANDTLWDTNVHWEDACPAVGTAVTAWKLSVVVKAQYPFLTPGILGFAKNLNFSEQVVIDLEPTSSGTCSPTPS